jgi:hypothetical protein
LSLPSNASSFHRAFSAISVNTDNIIFSLFGCHG